MDGKRVEKRGGGIGMQWEKWENRCFGRNKERIFIVCKIVVIGEIERLWMTDGKIKITTKNKSRHAIFYILYIKNRLKLGNKIKKKTKKNKYKIRPYF